MAARTRSTHDSTPKAEAAPPRGGPAAPFLFLGGLVALAVGAALVVGPRYVPEIEWYGKVLGRAGLGPGPFAVAGSVLFGLGLLARRQSVLMRNLGRPSAALPAMRELAGEVETLRDGVHQLLADTTQLREGEHALLQAVQGLAQTVESVAQGQGGQDNEQRNSLFRMAASLDQLGARLDKRFEEQRGALHAALGDLAGDGDDGSSLTESLRPIEERLAALFEIAERHQSALQAAATPAAAPARQLPSVPAEPETAPRAAPAPDETPSRAAADRLASPARTTEPTAPPPTEPHRDASATAPASASATPTETPRPTEMPTATHTPAPTETHTPAPTASAPESAPSSPATNEPVTPPEPGGLGLLDDLDDEGPRPAAAPRETPAENLPRDYPFRTDSGGFASLERPSPPLPSPPPAQPSAGEPAATPSAPAHTEPEPAPSTPPTGESPGALPSATPPPTGSADAPASHPGYDALGGPTIPLR